MPNRLSNPCFAFQECISDIPRGSAGEYTDPHSPEGGIQVKLTYFQCQAPPAYINQYLFEQSLVFLRVGNLFIQYLPQINVSTSLLIYLHQINFTLLNLPGSRCFQKPCCLPRIGRRTYIFSCLQFCDVSRE